MLKLFWPFSSVSLLLDRMSCRRSVVCMRLDAVSERLGLEGGHCPDSLQQLRPVDCGPLMTNDNVILILIIHTVTLPYPWMTMKDERGIPDDEVRLRERKRELLTGKFLVAERFSLTRQQKHLSSWPGTGDGHILFMSLIDLLKRFLYKTLSWKTKLWTSHTDSSHWAVVGRSRCESGDWS